MCYASNIRLKDKLWGSGGFGVNS